MMWFRFTSTSDGAWYTGPALRDAAYLCDPSDADATGRWKHVAIWTITSGSGAAAGLPAWQGRPVYRRQSCEVVARLDVVIPRCMHGLHGEDGALQGLLEMANLPYASTGVVGSAVGMDKIIMKQFFRGAGLPVLPVVLVPALRL